MQYTQLKHATQMQQKALTFLVAANITTYLQTDRLSDHSLQICKYDNFNTPNHLTRKRLRSAGTNRYEPFTTRLKFGERCFSHAGPKAWNALPAEFQDLTDHSAFKRQLKTFLFECVFTT